MIRDDRRGAAAALYRQWYKTREWAAARVAQFKRQPFCERHLARGQRVPATVVNHRVPHKGNWALFIDPANHESTCKPCHDSSIQSEEKLGYSKAVDADGWPVDPRHRANRG